MAAIRFIYFASIVHDILFQFLAFFFKNIKVICKKFTIKMSIVVEQMKSIYVLELLLLRGAYQDSLKVNYLLIQVRFHQYFILNIKKGNVNVNLGLIFLIYSFNEMPSVVVPLISNS